MTGIATTVEEADMESVGENDGHAGEVGHQEYQENREGDEIGAAMLSISVEEFRRLADESGYGSIQTPPTPRAYFDSDDEA